MDNQEITNKLKRLTKIIASDYILTDVEKNEIANLLGGLVLYLKDETDALVPAFVIGDLDISIYTPKYEENNNCELVEDSPAGFEVNDYTVEFVRNPENHELVISYRQLLDKMTCREYAWNWDDLKEVEKESIRTLVKTYIADRDWIEVDRTYVYDEYYSDAIMREGKSRVKLGVKCGEDYFTIFVLKAKPSDDLINDATDWLGNRMYKEEVSRQQINLSVNQPLNGQLVQ